MAISSVLWGNTGSSQDSCGRVLMIVLASVLGLSSFYKLVSQIPRKFYELPNIPSTNLFSARIIQSWVLLFATKNSGRFSLGDEKQGHQGFGRGSV